MSCYSRRLLVCVGFACLGFFLACGGGGSSPAAPSPAPAAPTATAITVTGPGCVAGVSAGTSTPIRTLCTAADVKRGDTLQLAATATMSDSTTQTVTSQAQWTSSNQAVATVNNAGLVTIQGTGDSDVLATYQGKSAGHTVRSTVKVPYVGTTSQGLPILIEVGIPQQPSAGTGFRVLGAQRRTLFTFSDGVVLEVSSTSRFTVNVAADGSFRYSNPWIFPNDYFEGVLRLDGTLSGTYRSTYPIPVGGETPMATVTYNARLSETWPAGLLSDQAALGGTWGRDK